jgi:hypothetical protein
VLTSDIVIKDKETLDTGKEVGEIILVFVIVYLEVNVSYCISFVVFTC